MFDLQEWGWLDLDQLRRPEDQELETTTCLEPELEEGEEPELASLAAVESEFVVENALDQRSGDRAVLLKRLVRTAGLAGGSAVVGTTKNPDKPVGAYVRVHDALLEEPTRAAVFRHWNSRVSFGFIDADPPEGIAADVTLLKHRTYGVSMHRRRRRIPGNG